MLNMSKLKSLCSATAFANAKAIHDAGTIRKIRVVRVDEHTASGSKDFKTLSKEEAEKAISIHSHPENMTLAQLEDVENL